MRTVIPGQPHPHSPQCSSSHLVRTFRIIWNT
jgi:hypothetical protein